MSSSKLIKFDNFLYATINSFIAFSLSTDWYTYSSIFVAYVNKIDIVASVILPCTTNIPPHNNINGSLKFLNVCVPIPYITFIFASFISFFLYSLFIFEKFSISLSLLLNIFNILDSSTSILVLFITSLLFSTISSTNGFDTLKYHIDNATINPHIIAINNPIVLFNCNVCATANIIIKIVSKNKFIWELKNSEYVVASLLTLWITFDLSILLNCI